MRTNLHSLFLLALVACHPDPNGPGKPGNPTDPTPPGTTPPGTTPTNPAVEAVCDAGDDVWVQRVFPLVLGRKAHGATEVTAWANLAAAEGRPAVIRALAKSSEYGHWWKTQMSDLVYAARDGYYTDSSCFENPKYNMHDGDLADFISTRTPESDYGKNFNMADVLVDAVIADNVSVVYQANLFAKNNFTDIMVFDPIEAETQIRKYQGDQLLTVYTDRNLACMGCHNSEFSVTDDPDPTLDRAWGRGALFEKALFDASNGPADQTAFYAMSKGYGVVQSFYYYYGDDDTVYDDQPWGMDNACGTFATYSHDYDYLGDDAFFGGDYGQTGSVWDMDRLFRGGVDAMVGGGIQIAPDRSIDAGQAFAYLTAQNFVDQTWKLAFGNRLLLPYGMARNEMQQERLGALTDHFVKDGWSLVELLVDITSDPYFNAGLPETCPTEPYGMEPVVDPYTVLEVAELANNGPGDLVHRHTARTLLNSTYDALEWGTPTEYFSGYSFYGDPENDLQVALGVFHSDAAPGFNGIDFQGALTWESTFYLCSNPDGGGGYLRTLYDAGYNADATIEDMVVSLKDRLLSHGVIDDDEEQALIEDLMKMPMSAKVQNVDPMMFGRYFGLLCGVLTQSPDYMMTVEPLPVGPVPFVNPGAADDCANFETLASAAGYDVTCDGSAVE